MEKGKERLLRRARHRWKDIIKMNVKGNDVRV
jgi:hypothetical protein